ncbi:hypothetical protein [Hoeflea sp.]|uniref:hypothetical protein n=1 Tax=Hoeflea sp. TaxID=1940281 RepID=UPI0019BADB9E|nr:hypothetical protein [Hoeflea sp.]MBC7285434.1 hypothetical protein [Hoeflea sp.]
MTNTEKHFVEMAAPEYWYSYAHELADTADQIYRASKKQWVAYLYSYADGSKNAVRRPLVSRPVLLMYGLSFENLIKGLLISEDPTLLKGGKLSKHLLGHDLVKLASRLKSIKLNANEKNLLVLLSDVIPYHGRYPVPRNAQDVKPENFINERVYDDCRELFARLEMQLYRLNFEGIDAPEGVRFAKLRLTHLDAKADFITDELKMDLQDLYREFREAEGNESE